MCPLTSKEAAWHCAQVYALFPTVRMQHVHMMNVDVSPLRVHSALPLPQGLDLIMDED